MKHPEHPLGQLATFELRNYRSDLERAIASLPPTSARVDQLRQRLDEVIEAQEAHARASGCPFARGARGSVRARPPGRRTGRGRRTVSRKRGEGAGG